MGGASGSSSGSRSGRHALHPWGRCTLAAVFVTFLTDYGRSDDFVGVCHGVIARIAPEARVHRPDARRPAPRRAQRRGDPAARAAVLPGRACISPSSIPASAATRRAVALRVAEEDRILVGPDNGAAVARGRALRRRRRGRRHRRTRRCGSSRCRRPSTGATCSPPSPRTSRPARRSARAGEPIDPDELVQLELPPPDVEGERVVAHALAFDRFGNVTLDVEHEELARPPGCGSAQRDARQRRRRAIYAPTFADVAPGELLVYEDAYRTLALAVNRGSAAELLGLEPDDEVAASSPRREPLGTPRLHLRADRLDERPRPRARRRRRAARHARHRRRADGRPRTPGTHVVRAAGQRAADVARAARRRPSCCRSPPAVAVARGASATSARSSGPTTCCVGGPQARGHPRRGPPAGGLGGARDRRQRRGASHDLPAELHDSAATLGLDPADVEPVARGRCSRALERALGAPPARRCSRPGASATRCAGATSRGPAGSGIAAGIDGAGGSSSRSPAAGARRSTPARSTSAEGTPGRARRGGSAARPLGLGAAARPRRLPSRAAAVAASPRRPLRRRRSASWSRARASPRAAPSSSRWRLRRPRRPARPRCDPGSLVASPSDGGSAAVAARPLAPPARRGARPLPLGKLRSSSRASARGLARHARARAAQHLLGLRRVRERGGQQRGRQAAVLLARRVDEPARVARVRAARGVDEQAEQPLGLRPALRPRTPRAPRACTRPAARSRRWPGRGGRCASRRAPAA